MFCSRCGKTLLLDVEQCPSCGQPVGESRFEGSPYTSAQSHVIPGRAPSRPVVTEAPEPQNYTRASYTSKGEEAVTGDADARTSYRPVYEGASAPEDIRSEMREVVRGGASITGETEEAPEEPREVDKEELSEEARSAIEEVDEQLRADSDLDLSKFRARPIESAGQTGISSDVSEFMQKLEGSDAPRRAVRRRVDYDDYETQPDEGGEAAYDGDQDEVFEDIDEEEFEELRHSSFGPAQILKIAAALVVVAAIFIGGVMWFRYIRGAQSSAPIENVSEELYDSGLAMIKAHAANETSEAMLTAYTSSGNSLTTLVTELDADSAELQALRPAEPTENEALFMDALSKIQTNIANCITSDALAISQNDAEAIAGSDERWSVVTNAVAQLENASSAAELTAIVNGEVVDVTEAKATPSPTPAPNYNTLSKGDKSDAVLDLQNRLYELGFLLDQRDGAYGSNTQTAVKMFQQAAGLSISGIADSETQAALYSDDAPRTQYAQPTVAPAATPSPTPAPEDTAAPEETPAA